MPLASAHEPSIRRSISVMDPDAQLLAAVDRAARHRNGHAPAAWMVLEHLGAPTRSPEGREARTRLGSLEQRGLLKRSRSRSTSVWTLTRAGQRRLQLATVDLPESPQHRRWRQARSLAEREAPRFRQDLEEALRDGLVRCGRRSKSASLMLAHE
jgi:hypothetical protein